MNKYVKKMALMVPYVKRHYEEIERLRTMGLKYHSCWPLDSFSLHFSDLIDANEECIRFCCEPLIDYPRLALCETVEESVKAFVKLRAEIIAESIKLSLLGKFAEDEDRSFTSKCAKCPRFQLDNWRDDGLIHHIVLSMYPSPCQCKCIYCNVPPDLHMQQINAESTRIYEKIFAIIDWMQKNGMTAKDLTWFIAGGEITIHPFKDRILSLVKNQTASFCTNCFIFDEKIAANLSINKYSTISFSIDCGTPETWYKIKGVDNFYTVIENLEKYMASGTRQEQIQLKYIILPGINDNLEEYQAIVGILKKLKIGFMQIAVDFSTRSRESFVRSAGYLLAMLRKNNITTNLTHHFYQDEIDKASAFADELLESGEV